MPHEAEQAGTAWSRLGPWARGAVVVWTAILLVIGVRILLSPRAHSVLPIYTTAAQRWLAGADLYGPLEGLDRYRYSPLVAVLMVPFSLLPASLGGLLWRLVNAGVYLGGLAWWSRVALPLPLTREQRALLLLLATPLSVGCLNNGQTNLLVLGLLLAAGAGVVSDRWNVASACLALACLFKLYPIALGLLLAAVYPRALALRLTVAVVVGLALPFGLQHPGYVAEQYASWVGHFEVYDRQGLPVYLWYRDLRLLCRVWLVPLGSQAYLAIQLLAAAAVAGLGIAGRCRGWSRRQLAPLLLGLACCWMTALGPATESCTYVLLAPALAWGVLDTRLSRQPWGVRGGMRLSYGLLVLVQISSWFPLGRQFRTLGPQPLAALLFLGCLVALAVRDLWQRPARETSGQVSAARAA
jgi:hypothetical protein